MKNILKLLLVLFPFIVNSQTQTENYIKTVKYKVRSTVKIPSPAVSQAAQNVTYFDGLGRPIQQTAFQQSKSGNDIITPIKYDGFGRQEADYLPFKSASTNMAFDPGAEANALSYYANPNPAVNGNPAMEATSYPFSKKEFETSPLNRVLKQAAPGNDWRLGSGHEIKIDYQANTASDQVKLFSANTSWDASLGLYTVTFLNSGFYSSNELYKTVTYDENTAAAPTEINGSTVEFKNKEGQVVLKRTYDAQARHDTYYVYDIYGNLTFVIPPKAADLIDGTTSLQADVTSTAVVTSGNTLNLTASNSIKLLTGFHAQAGSTFSAVINNGTQRILDDLCYQYKYDSRNRMAEKKLPGKQWEFIVYDKLDRPVATGPANSPFSDLSAVGWIITKYDAFNRPVYTGWSTSAPASSAGRASLQNTQNSLTVINESKTTSGTLDGIPAYYTNNTEPKAFKLLSVNYYDNYNFPNLSAISVPLLSGVEGQNILASIKGLASASWTRVLTSSLETLAEITVTFYDESARPVRVYNLNHLGGYTYSDIKLDFTGKPEYSITRHKRTASDAELTTRDSFTYSAQDRLITQTHQINNGPVEVIANNDYDELGQLISKKVGNNTQNINYSYNTRGWLTAINDVGALSKPGDPKDLFAFQINYNSPTSGGSPLYNGNISQTHWKTSNSENIIRNYNYTYDKLNRLTNADFRNNTTSAENSSYFEKLQYDKNGNITFLHRSGDVVSQANLEWMDYMIYSYNGNQLNRVKEEGNNYFGFTTQIAQTNAADQYKYDANGNMILDTNKEITSITYNHLNLPLKVTFASTGNILYIYNAQGQKIQKIVNRTGVPQPTITDYLGVYQYENTTLKFFPTAEGYVEPSGGSYRYIYQYKDHLGNIRLSYDKSLTIQEENNYYPFGLKHIGYNGVKIGVENKYKYNGKELQDELELNFYDYGARNYDLALGRWMNIDPLAETSRKFNPYTYALNNPMYFIDPDGMEAKDYTHDSQNINGRHQTWADRHQASNSNNDIEPKWKGAPGETYYDKSDNTAYQANPDGSWIQATELNETFFTSKKKKLSFFQNYYKGYFDSYKYIDGTNPYSPYIPDAIGLSANVNVSTGIFGEFHATIGFAFDQNNNYVFFGSYGGNIGYNGTIGMPKFGFGLSYDMYDNYGGNTDVFSGMRDYSVGYTGSLIFGGTYTKSAESDFKVSDKGVETKSLNLQAGFNGGATGSRTIIFYNSKKN